MDLDMIKFFDVLRVFLPKFVKHTCILYSNMIFSFCKGEILHNKSLLIDTNIIKPHRNTLYIDAAYCYRSSSVFCQSVCLSH